MEVKIGNDDFNLFMNENRVILKGKDDFILFGSSRNFNGCGKFRSVSNHALEPDLDGDLGNDNRFMENLVLEKKLATPAAIILTPSSSMKNEIVTTGPVSAIISMAKKPNGPSIFGNVFISTLVVVNAVLDQNLLLELLINIQQTLANVFGYLDINTSPCNKNNPQSILIACKGVGGQQDLDKIPELVELVQVCVEKATSSALKDLGYPPTITQILSASGVEIDELVVAGAELLVGVDDSPELRAKIKAQLEKALQDINVISLVLAGIRVEDDYQHHRVRNVEVDDDPAYLYADEVLGMAIANQIAGTKAIFNFKRYDEKKPGIISKLGPMLDDVCAGLVAGSMSKIFEE
jgi:alpha-ribazole phosphatase CobZ